MLKFFRNIRKGLLSENRIGKYILYAAGEIVLVVIGILIALNLNNRNEQRKTEAKVELIFNEIMEELISDIEEIRMPMGYFALRDSTIQLVLSEKITYEDYRMGRLPFLNNLTAFHNPVNLTQHAYNNLIRDLDAVPPRFKSVINDLNDLYNYNKNFVTEANRDMADFIADNQRFGMRNYSWFYSRNDADWERMIQYKLEDFRYKNEVSEYYILGIGNQLRMSLMYRDKAISCYKMIAELLNKSPNHESFEFDTNIAAKLEGDWYLVNEPDIVVSYYLKDNRLFRKDNMNPNRVHEVYYLPALKKILDRGLQYGTLVEDNDGLTIKFNYYDLKRVE